MIKKLRVQNFRSLKDVEMDFEPFTILIGPNDSGKSSILDAIYYLGQSATRPLLGEGGEAVMQGVLAPEFQVWQRDETQRVQVRAERRLPAGGDGDDYLYDIALARGQLGWRMQAVVELLRRMTRPHEGRRPMQIIVSTHNPLFLNWVEPEEIRVFWRDSERGTIVRRWNEIPETKVDGFDPGEVWYSYGEERLVARGVRDSGARRPRGKASRK